jgi:hypothetical protein
MDEDEQRHLATDEIALMREIIKWRKANGVRFFQWRPGVAFGAFTEWERWSRGIRIRMAYEHACGGLIIVDTYGPGGGHEARFQPTSVIQAADLLVAYGYLPARFSSAYRAGWEALGMAMTRPYGADGMRDVSGLSPAGR